MVCEWPQLKLDLFDKIKEVKYVNEKGTTRKSHNNLKGVVGSGELRHKINKPWVLPGKRNTYLDRIAMQQDIEETSVTDSKQSVPVRQDLDLRYDPKLRYDVNLRQHAKLQQDPKLQQDALMTQDVPLKQDVSEELILEKYTFLRNGSSDRFTATHNDMS